MWKCQKNDFQVFCNFEDFFCRLTDPIFRQACDQKVTLFYDRPNFNKLICLVTVVV